jgi:hypothetical protein
MPDYQVPLNSIGSYDLSAHFTDDDGNPLTMTADVVFAGGMATPIPTGIMNQPAWSTLTITPTVMADLGTYLVTIYVTDSLASISGSFTIEVINTPPYFVSAEPADFIMKFNTTHVYYLPTYKDNEGHTVTVMINSVPAGQMDFATIVDNQYIEFYPSDWSQFKDFDLFITLTDGIANSVDYPFKLTMTNSAPVLQTKLPNSVKV